jgi:hypothetical protein
MCVLHTRVFVVVFDYDGGELNGVLDVVMVLIVV